MRLTARINLPPPPATDDPEVARYLAALNRALQQAFADVYVDLSQGQSTLTTVSAAPAATEVDEGQVVLRTDAGNEALYVNVDGTIKSVALT